MKKIYLLILVTFWFGVAKAQEFYDLNTIETIKITFAESNWDALLDAEKAGDENYIMAQSVSINDVVFDSVGVKYKGNSTYSANQVKNPFHIELDTYKDQDYEGYTDIKLSNAANDPSFIREVLSYQIVRQYMDAPLSNYANIYVNDVLIGLYSNSEAVSKKFLKSHFGSKNNTFVKCNPPDGAGPSTSNLPNLVYQGTDSTDYYSGYELKSDYGWSELIDLCDTLTNQIDAIEQILDVDRALWMLAFDNALVNLDSYIGAFSQNYYLYRDDNGRFIPVVWDLNESFGRFSQTGSTTLNSTSSKQQLSYLLNVSDSDFPLVKKLLAVPMYKRMYLAHLKTMMLENFDNNSYYTTGQELQTTIDAAVQADVNKFFTYSNFKSNITTDITSGIGPSSSSTPGITNLMDGRNAYLLALSDFTNEAPSIANIEQSEESPVVGTTLSISATITSGTAVYLSYRNDSELPFTRIQMVDDGTMGDLSASDGIYTTTIQMDDAYMQYYIYAENDEAGMFSPQRAEHEFYEITASLGEVTASDLVINEFMASNTGTYADLSGEYDDWIELYNASENEILLDGYTLTDDIEDLKQWEFPEGTKISAGGYLIIWADNEEDQEGLHANFKLSSSGEDLILLDSTSQVIDQLTFDTQIDDVSYGRLPNATGPFYKLVPSPMELNMELYIADTITLTESPIVINEFMASNESTMTDQDNEFDDWIELYNNSNEAIDLGGYYLSDDIDNQNLWEFPAGTTISAGGYLIVWADEDLEQEGLHADFKLSASGEELFLTNSSGQLIDTVLFAEQSADISYGRFPNGTGNFRVMNPTFNDENQDYSSIISEKTQTLEIVAYPNPASSYCHIEINGDLSDDSQIAIYNLTGQVVFQSNTETQFNLNTSTWKSGIYFVRVENAVVKIVIN
jgi:hypothetical protein